MKKIITVGFVLTSISSANAGFVQQSYTDFAISTDRHLSAIAKSFDLSAKDEVAAKQASSSYVFMTACLGSITGNDADKLVNEGVSSVELANNIDPKNKFTSAIANMVAHHTTANFGRPPLQDTCKYVSETAFSNLSPDTKIGYCYYDGKPYKNQINLTCVNKD